MQIPMLFLQGTRDALAGAKLMQKLVQGLGARAPSCSSKTPITSFMCPPAADAMKGRSQRRCWML
ncbi:MAG: hypothetical protein WBF11_06755 [Methyloceanibacter sp.]